MFISEFGPCIVSADAYTIFASIIAHVDVK